MDVKKQDLVKAALQIAADKGWAAVDFIALSAVSGVPLADIFARFDVKDDVLIALGRMVDEQVAEAFGDVRAGEDCRDRLFDVLMERFDVLNTHRTGVLAILDGFKGDPKQAVIVLPHLGRSMTRMLELSGMETRGIRGALRVAGLSALYVRTLHVWMQDESADMARVMATLDQDLKRAEGLANFLSL